MEYERRGSTIIDPCDVLQLEAPVGGVHRTCPLAIDKFRADMESLRELGGITSEKLDTSVVEFIHYGVGRRVESMGQY